MSAVITKETLNDPKFQEFVLKFLNETLTQGATMAHAREHNWYDGELLDTSEACEDIVKDFYKKFKALNNNEARVVIGVNYEDCRSGDDYNPKLCKKCYKDSISYDTLYVYAGTTPVSQWANCKCTEGNEKEK